MNSRRLLLLIGLLLCGCTGIDSDAPGLKPDEVQSALERGIVLPGMTSRQVRYVWGEPQERRAKAGGEVWIYQPDVPAAGMGYHPVVTVTFVQGAVDSVMNGDLKRKQAQMSPYVDLARRAPRGYNNGFGTPSPIAN